MNNDVTYADKLRIKLKLNVLPTDSALVKTLKDFVYFAIKIIMFGSVFVGSVKIVMFVYDLLGLFPFFVLLLVVCSCTYFYIHYIEYLKLEEK